MEASSGGAESSEQEYAITMMCEKICGTFPIEIAHPTLISCYVINYGEKDDIFQNNPTRFNRVSALLNIISRDVQCGDYRRFNNFLIALRKTPNCQFLLQGLQQHIQEHRQRVRSSLSTETVQSLQYNFFIDKSSYLTQFLSPDDIIDHLISTRLVGPTVREQVCSFHTIRSEKNRIIVDELSRGKQGTVETFCQILRKTRTMKHIAEKLEKEWRELLQSHSSESSDYHPPSSQSGPTSSHTTTGHSSGGVYTHDPSHRRCDSSMSQPSTPGTPYSSGSSYSSQPSTPTEITSMKLMLKHVVDRLAPYWVLVCDYLNYPVPMRNWFGQQYGQVHRRCLVAVLEDWISTDNGRSPKTWSTFISALSEIKDLEDITRAIRLCLEHEGVIEKHQVTPGITAGDVFDGRYNNSLPAAFRRQPPTEIRARHQAMSDKSHTRRVSATQGSQAVAKNLIDDFSRANSSPSSLYRDSGGDRRGNQQPAPPHSQHRQYSDPENYQQGHYQEEMNYAAKPGQHSLQPGQPHPTYSQAQHTVNQPPPHSVPSQSNKTHQGQPQTFEYDQKALPHPPLVHGTPPQQTNYTCQSQQPPLQPQTQPQLQQTSRDVVAPHMPPQPGSFESQQQQQLSETSVYNWSTNTVSSGQRAMQQQLAAQRDCEKSVLSMPGTQHQKHQPQQVYQPSYQQPVQHFHQQELQRQFQPQQQQQQEFMLQHHGMLGSEQQEQLLAERLPLNQSVNTRQSGGQGVIHYGQSDPSLLGTLQQPGHQGNFFPQASTQPTTQPQHDQEMKGQHRHMTPQDQQQYLTKTAPPDSHPPAKGDSRQSTSQPLVAQQPSDMNTAPQTLPSQVQLDQLKNMVASSSLPEEMKIQQLQLITAQMQRLKVSSQNPVNLQRRDHQDQAAVAQKRLSTTQRSQKAPQGTLQPDLIQEEINLAQESKHQKQQFMELFKQLSSQAKMLDVQSPEFLPQEESQKLFTEFESLHRPVSCEQHEQEISEQEQWQQLQQQPLGAATAESPMTTCQPVPDSHDDHVKVGDYHGDGDDQKDGVKSSGGNSKTAATTASDSVNNSIATAIADSVANISSHPSTTPSSSVATSTGSVTTATTPLTTPTGSVTTLPGQITTPTGSVTSSITTPTGSVTSSITSPTGSETSLTGSTAVSNTQSVTAAGTALSVSTATLSSTLSGAASSDISTSTPVTTTNQQHEEEPVANKPPPVLTTSVPTLPTYGQDAGPSSWIQGNLLGSGTYGKVYLCYCEDTGAVFAVKEVDTGVDLNEKTHKAVVSLEEEINALKTLRHERIVSYIGTERAESVVRIFMEYMPGGSIYQYLSRHGPMKEGLIKKYTRQLLEGIVYLHNKKIVHRDIKGANILRDSTGNVKIADFGTCKQVQTIYMSKQASATVGTWHWMAPEAVRGTSCTTKADIWSIGCTIAEMFTGNPPLHDLPFVTVVFMIGNNQPMSFDRPSNCSELAYDFIMSCFVSDASKRPTAVDLLKHNFMMPPSPSSATAATANVIKVEQPAALLPTATPKMYDIKEEESNNETDGATDQSLSAYSNPDTASSNTASNTEISTPKEPITSDVYRGVATKIDIAQQSGPSSGQSSSHSDISTTANPAAAGATGLTVNQTATPSLSVATDPGSGVKQASDGDQSLSAGNTRIPGLVVSQTATPSLSVATDSGSGVKQASDGDQSLSAGNTAGLAVNQTATPSLSVVTDSGSGVKQASDGDQSLSAGNTRIPDLVVSQTATPSLSVATDPGSGVKKASDGDQSLSAGNTRIPGLAVNQTATPSLSVATDPGSGVQQASDGDHMLSTRTLGLVVNTPSLSVATDPGSGVQQASNGDHTSDTTNGIKSSAIATAGLAVNQPATPSLSIATDPGSGVQQASDDGDHLFASNITNNTELAAATSNCNNNLSLKKEMSFSSPKPTGERFTEELVAATSVDEVDADTASVEQSATSQPPSTTSTVDYHSVKNIMDNSIPAKSLPEITPGSSNTSSSQHRPELPPLKLKRKTSKSSMIEMVRDIPSSPTPICEGTHITKNYYINVTAGQLNQGCQLVSLTSSGQQYPSDFCQGTDQLNSLGSFTEDIINSVDVDTILPLLMSHLLVTRDHIDYLSNPHVPRIEKQRKLSFILATLNEECVKKFLQCLKSTSDYDPHESLLRKICGGKSK